MSRSIIFKTLVLLAVTVQVSTQYVDFFQSFSTFLQPQQTTKRPANRQTTKSRHQDAIFFDSDSNKKSGRSDAYSTVKPKRKSKTTTISPWYQESVEHNKNNNVNSQERPTNIYNNDDNKQRINNNKSNGNNRRVDNDYNTAEDSYNNYEVTNNNAAKNYDRQTDRPVYNTNFNVAQKPINSRPIYNSHTTKNPLLNRPGVRPAAVDDNRPPITNRPVTSSPVYTQNPFNSNGPNRNDASETDVDIGRDEDDMSEAEKRRYIEIAEQKCDEYKALNTKKVVALPLASLHASQGVELNVSTCTPINIPLIIGGKIVSIKEFPHMSLVGWKKIQNGGYSWKCGGSLISEQFILTAGHCTYYDKDSYVVSGPPSAVQLGSSYIDGGDAIIVSVSSVVRHPKYKLRRSYYDVALLKLITTVKFSNSISPACLGVPPPVGDRIIATGWGRTEFSGDASKELRSVSVPIWEMGECRDIWGTSLKLPEGPSPASQLCAGERGGGRDTCQGDSGGPAQIQDGCTWRVVAVTSVGRSCGAAETPALYARLPRAFIASQIYANVKLNPNKDGFSNQGVTGNRDNENNNWGASNGFSNQGVAGNNQNIGNNRPDQQTNGNNRFGNTQSSVSKRVITVISDSGVVNNDKQFSSHNSGNNRDDFTRPSYVTDNNRGTGNNYFVTSHASENNRNPVVSRPGNHQTIDNNNRDTNAGNNFFVTSHTSGNRKKPVVSRPGNHQTIENENRDSNTGSNYFVTSHTRLEQNIRNPVSRPGNHQTLQNINRFADSQNSESNQDVIFDTPVNDDTGSSQYSNVQHYNTYNYNVRKTNTWATKAKTETSVNRYNEEQNNNYRNPQSSNTYSSYESHNSDYGTTESVHNNGYNEFNNGYNANNNRDFLVANRPWNR